MSEADDFPQSQAMVAPHELVIESLGWQSGTWGAYLLVAGSWCFVQSGAFFLWLGWAVLAAGLALVLWEGRRRRNRTAVCVRGPRLGIYRHGKLDMEVSRAEIALLETPVVNTIQVAMAPVVGFMLGLIPVISFQKPGSGMSAMDAAAGLALCAASISSFVSLICTRLVWRIFRLPCEGKLMAYEDFCVPRGQAGLLTGDS